MNLSGRYDRLLNLRYKVRCCQSKSPRVADIWQDSAVSMETPRRSMTAGRSDHLLIS